MSREYLRTRPGMCFTGKPTRYSCPDGLVVPLVHGPIAVQGKAAWGMVSRAFLDKHPAGIARTCRVVLEMTRFDPRKFGKGKTSHDLAIGEFERALPKQQAAAA